METIRRRHNFDMVHGAQEMFRVVLEALANPGRILDYRRQAAQFAGQGRWLAPALTLLDKETGFFWDGDPATGEEIRFLTGAPRVSLEEADFVFLSTGKNCPDGNSGPADQVESPHAKAARILARVKGGTHLDPHDSALLFISPGEETGRGPGEGGGEQREVCVGETEKASPGKPAQKQVLLRGPGVPPEGRRIDLFPAEAAWCRSRDERGFEYPCGMELIFLREDGSLVAITRKTEFLWAGTDGQK
jgi:alpha-D-ribose 1-methylphosphonate 5-triphosphate synthase subunit PhnH